METNHGLLISALLEAGFPVYPLNPKTVDRRRKPSGAKTDAIDAYFWPGLVAATWQTCVPSNRIAPWSRNSKPSAETWKP